MTVKDWKGRPLEPLARQILSGDLAAGGENGAILLLLSPENKTYYVGADEKIRASHLLRACDALQECLCVFLRATKLLHGQNEQHVVIRAVVHPREQRIRPLCVYLLTPRGDAVFCAE